MATASYGRNPCALEPRSGVSALMQRFERKIDRITASGPNGDCHEWQGRVDGRGYGEIKVGGRYKKAHRLALFGFADWDNPLFACHRCDNPRCVNPQHLFAGQSVDNVRDMIAKGRRVSGSDHARKLNEQDVVEILGSNDTHVALSERYGVSPFTIRAIRSGRLYRDVAAKLKAA